MLCTHSAIQQTPDELPQTVFTRWVAYIRLCSFEIRHKKGVDNSAADGLSRVVGSVQICTIFSCPADVNNSVVDPHQPLRYHGFRLIDMLRYLVTLQDPTFDDDPEVDLSSMSHEQKVKSLKRFKQYAFHFFVQDVFMFARRQPHELPPRVLLYREEVDQVLKTFHDDLGHRGLKAVTSHVTIRYWWPGLQGDIHEHCKTCHWC